MKKFNVIEFSDCRWESEINEVWDVECESGKELFNFIIERECKDKNWVEYVSGMLNMSNEWVNKREEWEDIFGVEGELDNEIFEICMNDELRDVLVIREDSEYYGKFKRGVGERDKENLDLYFEIIEKII